MQIEGRTIGNGKPVFIVAEVSANHAGSLARAVKLIHAAKDAGADAVKFQCYRPEDMSYPGVTCPAGPWAGRDLVGLYEQAKTPIEWMPTLFTTARSIGIIPFASVFSLAGIAFLEYEVACPAYKIASAESNWPMLVAGAIATGRPVLISTSHAHAPPIQAGASRGVAMLYCPPGYPAHDDTLSMGELTRLSYACGVTGFSDHTVDAHTAVMAVSLGAKIIEKHIVLDKSEYPEDAHPLDWLFSMSPARFAEYVTVIRRTESMLGTNLEHAFTYETCVRCGALRNTEAERHPCRKHEASPYARSWRFIRDMSAGDPIGPMDVRVLRPAGGIDPQRDVVGRTVTRDSKAGDPVTEANTKVHYGRAKAVSGAGGIP